MAKLATLPKLKLLFLMETKREVMEIERLRVWLGFDSCSAVGCVGRAGGLALLWSSNIQVSVTSYSWASTSLPWFITGDFNELLFHNERCGGASHPDGLIRAFQEVVDECSLRDIP
ncbi:hypothetical protein PTKIN_Ptkin12aG0104100 [Pterospermum kingtungense]